MMEGNHENDDMKYFFMISRIASLISAHANHQIKMADLVENRSSDPLRSLLPTQ
jgi:hypothetical protein